MYKIVLFSFFPLVRPETGNQLPLPEQLPTLKTPGVALILGAGGNVGKVTHNIYGWFQYTERLPPLWQAVALKLYNEGYKIAVASRSQSDPTEGKALPLKVDVTKENEIISAFKQVEKSLGAPPNVVVYNGVLFNCTQIFNQLTLILLQ